MTPATPHHTLPAAFLAFSVLIGGVPTALAQAGKEKNADPPVLKGPSVQDRNVPGAPGDFGMGPGAGGGRAERVPPEVFREALGVLTAPDAPAAIRATSEQRDKIREFVEGFEQAARRFRREHADEIAELRRAAGEVAGNARRRNAEARPAENEAPRMLTPEEQEARERARVKLRELMAAAPKMEDVYTKAWAALSDAQRNAVEAKLDEWREKRAKEREDAYVRRRMNQVAQTPAAPQRPAAQARGEGEPMMTPAQGDDVPAERQRVREARRERLLRVFNRLSAEEQEQLLQRLEGRFAPRRNNATPDRATPKPPADPERVKVPSPEGEKPGD